QNSPGAYSSRGATTRNRPSSSPTPSGWHKPATAASEMNCHSASGSRSMNWCFTPMPSPRSTITRPSVHRSGSSCESITRLASRANRDTPCRIPIASVGLIAELLCRSFGDRGGDVERQLHRDGQMYLGPFDAGRAALDETAGVQVTHRDVGFDLAASGARRDAFGGVPRRDHQCRLWFDDLQRWQAGGVVAGARFASHVVS